MSDAPDTRPEGRPLLRIEQRNMSTPLERKPPWIKTRATTGPRYRELLAMMSSEKLHTV
jgi:lipoyl synthase